MSRLHLGSTLLLLGGLACCSLMGLRADEGAAPKGRPKAAAKEPAKDAADDKDAPKAPKAALKEAKGPKITPRQAKFLDEELLPALGEGDALALLELLSPQLPRLTGAQVGALNRALAERKAPTIDQMVTDARMSLIRLNIEDQAPEISAHELAIMLVEIKRQTEEIMAGVKKLEFMQDPLPSPKSLTEFRDHLWNAHVQNNQLINATALGTEGQKLARSPLVAKAKNATAEQKAAFATDFGELLARVKTLHQEVHERSIELRVNRVKFAVKVLAESKDIKERFFAAYAVGIDGELLKEGFKTRQGTFARDSLNAQGLVEALRSDVDRGKELAGDLVRKSQLLFAGLHWWRRGRYGRGPEGMGLLKSEAALTNLNAQIALFMPRVSPVPVDPAKNPLGQVPDYDRRHHYTWAWENRQFQVTGTGSNSSTRDVGSGTRSFNGGHFDGMIGDRFF